MARLLVPDGKLSSAGRFFAISSLSMCGRAQPPVLRACSQFMEYSIVLAQILATALLLGAADPGARPATASATSQPEAGTAADKKVCRRVNDTGSRISKQVCRPTSEWQAIDASNAKALRDGTVDLGRDGRNGRPDR